MWYGCGVLTEATRANAVLTSPVQFAGGVRLEPIPDWVKHEDALLVASASTRKKIRDAKYVFAVSYEAEAITSRAAGWNWPSHRSVWVDVEEKIWLAGLALWLVAPAPWSPGRFLHFEDSGDPKSVRRNSSCEMLKLQDHEIRFVPTESHFRRAAEIHGVILNLARDGQIWSAIRMLAFGLADGDWEPRFVMLWVVLEALFGPEDGREIRYRLSVRLAVFLGQTKEEWKPLFRQTMAGYDLRSKVVHGARITKLTDNEYGARMYEAETAIRQTLLKLLSEPGVAARFEGVKEREKYLDELIFDSR